MATTRSATAPRWRPAPFQDVELDLAMKTAFDNTDSLEKTSAQMPSTLHGSSIANGTSKVTGSLKGIATGLSTVSNVIVSIDSAGAPSNLTVTARPSPNMPGGIDIFVWMPTSAANNTPIAATIVAVIRWHAWGTITP